MRKVIYAHGVHIGGGLTLLKIVLDQVAGNANYRLILDSGAKHALEHYNLVNAEFFPSGLRGRLSSEIALRRSASHIEAILSFNSLPFLLPVASKVTVFFQNVNLLASVDRVSIVPILKRLLFRVSAARVDKFIVQTETVASQLSMVTDRPVSLGTLLERSLVESSKLFQDVSANIDNLSKRFVYVADGQPHKNHIRLLEAWELLHKKFPELNIELCLTIPKELNGVWMNLTQRFDVEGLSVRNEGSVSSDRVFELLEMSDALVFPSLHESLGLPLLEAAQKKIDIVAAEKDYVRDVVAPVETFDPQSHTSIARALARYLGLRWPPCSQPMSAQQLLSGTFDE